MSTILRIAQTYHGMGLSVIPIPHRRKGPILKGWQNLRLTEADLPEHFNGKPQNIGVLLGEPSGWIVDIDLDHPLAAELADAFLPPTGAVFGRTSNPKSHRLYYVSSPIKTYKSKAKCTDDAGKEKSIVELRSTGMQTVFPKSVHPSGERIQWEGKPQKPATVDPHELKSAVDALANEVHRRITGGSDEATEPLDDRDVAMIALARLSPSRAEAYDDWLQVGMALHSVDPSAAMLGEWDAWSSRAASYEAGACASKWGSFTDNGKLTIGSLIHWATTDSPDWKPPTNRRNANGVAGESANSSGDGETKETIAGMLVRLAFDAGADLFHSPDGDAFATVPVGGHRETHRVNSKGFRDWLSRLFHKQEKRVPGSSSLQDALCVLAGEARFDKPEHPVAVRVAEHDGKIYFDLGDRLWQTVEVTAEGWRFINPSPVRFIRSRGMLALPEPTRNGNLDDLRALVNVADDKDWLMIVAWLVATLRPTGPYPLLALSGEQGSGKSTACRMLRRMVDPNTADLRSEPRSEQDLIIAAQNGHVVGLENLSSVAPWLSDALCRLSTGGGFATRELYSDRDEIIFAATRPILMNGIPELAVRPDLADRTVSVELQAVSDDRRRDEAELWREYERIRPGVLGALLDCVSMALSRIDTIQLDRLPRMADFAKWIVAAEPAIGPEGRFLATYTSNRENIVESALDASPIGPAVRDLMNDCEEWPGKNSEMLGTASALLEELQKRATDAVQKERGWPKRANSLSGALRRIAPALRGVGINVTFDREGNGGRRTIRLAREGKTSSASSASSAKGNSSGSGLTMDASASSADRQHRQPASADRQPKTTANIGRNASADDADDTDDEIHTHSKADPLTEQALAAFDF